MVALALDFVRRLSFTERRVYWSRIEHRKHLCERKQPNERLLRVVRQKKETQDALLTRCIDQIDEEDEVVSESLVCKELGKIGEGRSNFCSVDKRELAVLCDGLVERHSLPHQLRVKKDHQNALQRTIATAREVSESSREASDGHFHS